LSPKGARETTGCPGGGILARVQPLSIGIGPEGKSACRAPRKPARAEAIPGRPQILPMPPVPLSLFVPGSRGDGPVPDPQHVADKTAKGPRRVLSASAFPRPQFRLDPRAPRRRSVRALGDAPDLEQVFELKDNRGGNLEPMPRQVRRTNSTQRVRSRPRHTAFDSRRSQRHTVPSDFRRYRAFATAQLLHGFQSDSNWRHDDDVLGQEIPSEPTELAHLDAQFRQRFTPNSRHHAAPTKTAMKWPNRAGMRAKLSRSSAIWPWRFARTPIASPGQSPYSGAWHPRGSAQLGCQLDWP